MRHTRSGVQALQRGLRGPEGERRVRSDARVVGQSTAADILFTGRRLDASEALRTGLLNAVLPPDQFDATVADTVAGIAANAPLTLRAAKAALQSLHPGSGVSHADA
ncbi:MAG: enoyl-CoA hydratase-related protein, partial [Pseudomonadota bacterium]